ncbi:hypothetical protein D9756_004171 [Leucocoprinus leucothites]|uniref:F-box domain-containing protein n=1 Tax=Leucocoprinus leucothites TaxID=201217 RepID=A0A8H5G0W9_9AGAR|nr:hypothetical protein D9756_004171 [Leucoagaricus leucothites]
MNVAELLSQQDIMDRHWTFFLPAELLCRIFYFSLSTSPFNVLVDDEFGDITLSLSLSKMTTPFTLGKVCRYWRYRAWHEPNLWNSVYLVANPLKAAEQATLLREWLLRAGELPLSIDIDCSDDEDRKWTSDFAVKSLLILEPIYEYSSRCISFRTRLPPSCLLLPPRDLPIPDPTFSRLTTLEISPSNLQEGVDDEEVEDLDIVSVFQHSTQLRHLALWELRNEQLDLPWTNLALTTIKTRTVSIYDCLVLLRNAPNVQECEFMDVTLSEDTDAFHDHLVLPRLNALHLDFTQLGARDDFIFHHITAPSLRNLQYNSVEGRAFPLEAFQLFQQRSHCPLASLEIRGPSMTAHDIRDCLSLVTQSLEQVLVEVRFTTNERILSYKPVLNNHFPRMRAATFSAPTSIIHALFPSP